RTAMSGPFFPSKSPTAKSPAMGFSGMTVLPNDISAAGAGVVAGVVAGEPPPPPPHAASNAARTRTLGVMGNVFMGCSAHIPRAHYRRDAREAILARQRRPPGEGNGRLDARWRKEREGTNTAQSMVPGGILLTEGADLRAISSRTS